MFADKYIERNRVPIEIQSQPAAELGMIIIIPCFREPDILLTLESVAKCIQPACRVEVIVLINHSEVDSDTVKAENHHTLQIVSTWVETQKSNPYHFHVIGPVELKKKWAGAGLARKRGMDEAVVRFNQINKSDGILVSLDADTLVEENYLIEIERYFIRNRSYAGATIRFRHQVEGLPERHLQGILLYEQYMEYYKTAMGYTGYPYSMFTVGSAFAVRAGAYVKRGGMNRRKAGEDFYFLQNLVQVGTVGEITTTVVHPSSRLSSRVPFGTGPLLQKWLTGHEDLTLTYNFDAFVDLKVFFDQIDSLYGISFVEYDELLAKLPVPVASFVKEVDFRAEIITLNRNCAGIQSFRLRFYHVFNAFKILKFLNFSHEIFYSKAELTVQMEKLSRALNPHRNK